MKKIRKVHSDAKNYKYYLTRFQLEHKNSSIQISRDSQKEQFSITIVSSLQ